MGKVQEYFLAIILVTLLVAVYHKEDAYKADLAIILDGLLQQELRYNSQQQTRDPRVAVGFGSCMDVFALNGLLVLDRAGLSPPSSPRHHNKLTTDDHVAETFAYFLQHGAAAERFVYNKRLFKKLIQSAESLPSNTTYRSIGGNGPMMAKRLACEGCKILLAAKMSPEEAKTLHSSIQLATSDRSAHIMEDIHLLLEYDVGECWGRYCSPRANRFIVHNDQSNLMLESLDGFEDALQRFSPDVLVVSGLQMLDNFPYDISIRTKKLMELQKLLASQPSSVRIHFEMASFTDEVLLRELLQYVIPYADSLGMNEQELDNLHNLLLYGNISYASDPYPRIATTLDLMRSLNSALQQSKKPGHRKVTRIHIHTLAYQIIATSQGSAWKFTRSAAAKASLVANRYVCNSSVINTDNAKLIMDDSFSISRNPVSPRVPLIDEAPVSCWKEGDLKICIAPNLVCTSVLQTGGAGDNISAAGLSIQI